MIISFVDDRSSCSRGVVSVVLQTRVLPAAAAPHGRAQARALPAAAAPAARAVPAAAAPAASALPDAGSHAGADPLTALDPMDSEHMVPVEHFAHALPEFAHDAGGQVLMEQGIGMAAHPAGVGHHDTLVHVGGEPQSLAETTYITAGFSSPLNTVFLSPS